MRSSIVLSKASTKIYHIPKHIMQEENTMKLGFIGCGNMAGAMMGGIIKNNIFRINPII